MGLDIYFREKGKEEFAYFRKHKKLFQLLTGGTVDDFPESKVSIKLRPQDVVWLANTAYDVFNYAPSEGFDLCKKISERLEDDKEVYFEADW